MANRFAAFMTDVKQEYLIDKDNLPKTNINNNPQHNEKSYNLLDIINIATNEKVIKSAIKRKRKAKKLLMEYLETNYNNDED